MDIIPLELERQSTKNLEQSENNESLLNFTVSYTPSDPDYLITDHKLFNKPNMKLHKLSLMMN